MTAGRRRGLLLPGVLTLLGLVVLVSLGAWQLERRTWKTALIATLEQRTAAPPDALPPPSAWGGLNPAEHEFRRVRFPATFAGELRQARLYTAGSALRDDVKEQGVFVFAPARVAGGGIVVVNRGYVPASAATPALDPTAGPLDLVGVMRWPEPPGWFVSAHSAKDNLWFVRDPQAMAAANQWGAVAPFYVELESPEPPGGLPHPARLKVTLSNNHLQYAVTWFGLALVLAVVFAAWAMGRRRADNPL